MQKQDLGMFWLTWLIQSLGRRGIDSSLGMECSEKRPRSEYFCEFWENINLHLKFMRGIFFKYSRFCPCVAREQLWWWWLAMTFIWCPNFCSSVDLGLSKRISQLSLGPDLTVFSMYLFVNVLRSKIMFSITWNLIISLCYILLLHVCR